MISKFKLLLSKQELFIIPVLIFAFFLRNYVMITRGVGMTINSDDQGYINSAIDFLQTGVLSYHFTGIPTVHIMPGQTFLLSAIFFVFGHSTLGLYIAKSTMIVFGLASVYGIYLIGKYIHGIWTGLIAALLLTVSVQHIVTDNLILTEAPFTACFIFFIYFSIRLAKERAQKHFYILLIFYLCGLMFRPTIALMPLIMAVYFLINKYPLRLMLRQSLIAFFVIVIVLSPWWIRNYASFNAFIPLTGSSGDPLLLGTFQGEGYPPGTYEETILKAQESLVVNDKYYEMKNEEIFAKERMKQWWNDDPGSMLRSYLILKPILLWSGIFYWINVLGVSVNAAMALHRFYLWIGFIGAIISLIRLKSRRNEIIFFVLTLLYFTVVNSYYFAYPRYTIPLEPFVFLGVALLITVLSSLIYSMFTKKSELKDKN